MGAGNPSSAAVSRTKGGVAPGLGLRKLQVRPLDLEVLEEPPFKKARCSNRRDFVGPDQIREVQSASFCSLYVQAIRDWFFFCKL